MFLGVVPEKCIAQILKSIDFGQWSEVFVCCSGTFRLDRAVLARWPDAKVHSNDVSLYSTPLGRLAAGQGETEFSFVGDLAWVEDLLKDRDYLARIAAVLVASDYAKHRAGKPNGYKVAHAEHYRAHFGELVDTTRGKVEGILERLPITDYFAGDWIEHMRNGIARGAGCVAFPPFFFKGYEQMFRYLNENIEWDAPDYEIYDPKQFPELLNEIADSGAPYCMLSDQLVEGHDPVIEFTAGRRLPHYCYANTDHASYVRETPKQAPFHYMPVDVTKLTETSTVRLVEAPADWMTFLKNVYLSKKIMHTPGMANFLVLVDGMLVGALIYTLPKFGDHSCIYLLSDFSITGEGRLAKLVARMALSKDVIDVLNRRYLERFESVVTTAFTDKPVSMKYRGVMKLIKRREADPPQTGNVLNYQGAVFDELPQDVYRWWWQKHGRKALAATQDGNTERRPENTAAA